MNNDSEHPVGESFGDVEHILVGAKSDTARIRKLTVEDRLEHADT